MKDKSFLKSLLNKLNVIYEDDLQKDGPCLANFHSSITIPIEVGNMPGTISFSFDREGEFRAWSITWRRG